MIDASLHYCLACELPHLQNGCAHAFHDGRLFCLEIIMIENLVFAEIQMVEIQEYKKIIMISIK